MLRDIKLITIQKGISMSHEFIRFRYIKFSKLYAKKIRKIKRYSDYIYIDKVFYKINSTPFYLPSY